MPTALFRPEDDRLETAILRVGVEIPRIERPAVIFEEGGYAVMPQEFYYEMKLLLAAGSLYNKVKAANEELICAHNAFTAIWPGAHPEVGLDEMPIKYFGNFQGEGIGGA